MAKRGARVAKRLEPCREAAAPKNRLLPFRVLLFILGMAKGSSQSWIADGEKYALLGFSVKVTDKNLYRLDLSPNFQIIRASDFRIPDEWRGWLGSIRVEEVEACDLFISSKLTSATPDVLPARTSCSQPAYGRCTAACSSAAPSQQRTSRSF